MRGITLIDCAVLFGIAVVLPLAIGGPTRWWEAAAASALVAMLLPTGPAAWVALGVPAAVAGPLLRAMRRRDILPVVACAYAPLGAAGAFVTSRAGASPFGIHEPIVELTAVHYMFAGAGATALAGAAFARAGGWHPVGVVAVACTIAAPPIVAAGFVTGAALPQVGGAVLMTGGVWLTAVLELREAAATRSGLSRALLAVSGLAVWAPMVLAVAWSAAQHWDVPALSVSAMVRTHGATNAVAFVLCGLAARRLTPADRPVAEVVA